MYLRLMAGGVGVFDLEPLMVNRRYSRFAFRLKDWFICVLFVLIDQHCVLQLILLVLGIFF